MFLRELIANYTARGLEAGWIVLCEARRCCGYTQMMIGRTKLCVPWNHWQDYTPNTKRRHEEFALNFPRIDPSHSLCWYLEAWRIPDTPNYPTAHLSHNILLILLTFIDQRSSDFWGIPIRGYEDADPSTLGGVYWRCFAVTGGDPRRRSTVDSVDHGSRKIWLSMDVMDGFEGRSRPPAFFTKHGGFLWICPSSNSWKDVYFATYQPWKASFKQAVISRIDLGRHGWQLKNPVLRDCEFRLKHAIHALCPSPVLIAWDADSWPRTRVSF